MQPRDRHGTPYADPPADDVTKRTTRLLRRQCQQPTQDPGGAPPAAAPAGSAPGTPHFEYAHRLIELDDLRRRGIVSEEEFAAKKSELLNRI